MLITIARPDRLTSLGRPRYLFINIYYRFCYHYVLSLTKDSFSDEPGPGMVAFPRICVVILIDEDSDNDKDNDNDIGSENGNDGDEGSDELKSKKKKGGGGTGKDGSNSNQ